MSFEGDVREAGSSLRQARRCAFRASGPILHAGEINVKKIRTLTVTNHSMRVEQHMLHDVASVNRDLWVVQQEGFARESLLRPPGDLTSHEFL